jgi:hypothetical protein
MTTEVLDIRHLVQSPAKVDQAIGNQLEIGEAQDPDCPVGSIPFRKRVRGVTVRSERQGVIDKVVLDIKMTKRFVTHVPQRCDD